MSQCVPHWDLDDGLARPPQIHASTSTTTNRNHARMSGFVASELTWANGPHGGALRLDKPVPKRPSPVAMTWGKPLEGGTLEVVVEQATRAPALDPTAAAAHCSPISTRCHLVPWLGSPLLPVPAAVDALVPSAESHPQDAEERRASSHLVRGSAAGTTDGGGTCAAWCSGRNRLGLGAGSVRVSVGTAQLCAGSIGLTLDTCETNGDGGMEDFTALASPLDGSPEKANTSCRRPPPTVSEDHDDSGDGRRSQDGCDEEGRSKNEKRGPSISTKRGRAAAVHNQAERRRRDRINQRMTTLQKLLPNSSKTDKASILDEVIGYVKQLQAQVQMMSRMNTAVTHMMTMMMPMALQQPQTAMMAQMGMAMGMGMVDVNTLGGAGKTGMPWPAFLPPAMSSSAVRDRDLLQAPGVALPPDPFAAFMACQAQQQPMAMDAYRRMAALHQQLYQLRPGSNHDNT